MQLWTKEHALLIFPALAVILVLGLILRKVLGDQPMEKRKLPLKILAVFFLVIEVGKQAASFVGGYDLYHIPLHFCSLFIFMIPLMAFYRGKYYRQVSAITASLCASVFLLMMIYPNLIFSGDNVRNFFRGYMDFHTVSFHISVLLAMVLIVSLRLYEPGRGEYPAVMLFMVCYCVIASVMAQVLKTNYNNFYTCNIPPLETVRLLVQDALGAVVAQVCYVLVVIVLDLLFVSLAFVISRWLCRRKQPVSACCSDKA